ncbi:NAD(P)H-hydrate epimerase / ADP-dependent (S)-NAD(P)H-hydrate dehydratase, partial [hydrothermal vent metagenome]
LKAAGWPVTLALLGSKAGLSGDAALMADKWDGAILSLTPDVLMDILADHGLVVDAIFGAGLCRPVEGQVAELIHKINTLDITVVAVDVPSGIDGNSGQIMGAALRANSTVTFFHRKVGHLLYPGREYCGELEVTDIGIPNRVLCDIKPETRCNDPVLWRDSFPQPAASGHKYNRGHGVVISGGMANGGAARLSARAALRIGAGLVSISCPADATPAHAAQLTAVMIKPFSGEGDIDDLLTDERLNCWCAGPGNGISEQTKSHVLKILAAGRGAVIDADGLSVFSDEPDELFTAIKASGRIPVLTPHDGEFSRLFPDLVAGKKGYNKLTSARQAATRAGAVVIFKGPDTVIASPDGRAVINDNAPQTLATAGSGDVLAGLCLGLMAQGMPAFEAASAAVWVHGAAASAFGPGLISEDIEGRIPDVLRYISELGE